MILDIILILVGITTIASIANLFNIGHKKEKDISMEVQLPGNLPIIALSNNGVVFNFLLDSGSNISHICAEYHELLESEALGVYKEGSVQGLGAKNIGITMCRAALKDIMGNEYTINLSISNHLKSVSDGIENSTGVRIHGLLGTDFLKAYNCALDFKTLKAFIRK